MSSPKGDLYFTADPEPPQPAPRAAAAAADRRRLW
jgi:hypothetical protein